jgi:hypothetical protein
MVLVKLQRLILKKNQNEKNTFQKLKHKNYLTIHQEFYKKY